ncbi:DsbA family oxidoreductase [Flavobacterium cerinum]|uniref:DsbA family oxidoreductase n=1 Tax=Flavobacterium cerinum TaxID=2502784 RepID=A0ABY5IUE7_9FLAO|nr:DsbA family oxidoreductase [Flavobacterium cerinum]UUC46419.1 DsbA family oxidoreductase [Flavobacterium cerinum]
MKIEIWSDIRCPFCYIGKTKFEKALAQFEHKDAVEITWRAFQLDPEAVTDTSISAAQSMASRKGISLEESEEMHANATEIASEVGLDFHFEKAVPANSMKAHQLSAFAKTKGVQNDIEDALFRAYFTEGKNIDDIPTLIAIGTNFGLTASDIQNVYDNNLFADEVKADQMQAYQFGINSVPFFVLNNKYAVKGAQPVDHFLATLNGVYQEMHQST